MGALSSTTKTKIDSGRTSEFMATNSEYGRDIQEVYGTDRMEGNLIWWSNIRLVKSSSTTTSGGKGGGQKQKTTTTTFEYFVDLDVAFGAGLATDVVRIWMDGKIVYSKDTGAEIQGLNFRFYPGSETQLPDPLVEAAAGANQATANRGIVHIVFQNLNLADFGNRLPAISAEIAYSGSGEVFQETLELPYQYTQSLIVADGGASATANLFNTTNTVRFNDLQNLLILPTEWVSDASIEGSILLDLDTLAVSVLPAFETSDIFGGGGYCQGVHELTNDIVYVAKPNVSPPRLDIWLRDDLSGSEIYFTDISRIRGEVLDFNGIPFYAGNKASNGDLGDLGIEVINLATNASLATFAEQVGYSQLPVKRGRNASDLPSGVVAEAFGIYTNNNSLKIIQILVSSTGTVTITEAAEVLVTSIVPGATAWNFNPAYAVDRSNGNIYFQHTIDGNPYVWCFRIEALSEFSFFFDGEFGFYFLPADPILWVTEAPFVQLGATAIQKPDGTLHGTPASGTIGQTSLNKGFWVWSEQETSNLCAIDLAEGTFAIGFDGSISYPSIGQGYTPSIAPTRFHWHDATKTLIGVVDTPSSPVDQGLYITRFSFSSSTEMDVRSTVRTMCVRAGLDLADIDVSNLPSTFPGVRSFKREGRSKASDGVANIIELLAYNAAEIDGQIVFAPKGQAASATIPEDDLVRNGSTEGETYVRASTRERDLPRVFEVNYSDSDNAYQPGVQRGQRPGNPVSSVSSDNIDSFDYSGAGKADAFQAAATRELYSAWAEVDKLTYRLPPRYLRVAPTDTIALSTEEVIYTGRARVADIGADFTVDIEKVIEIDGQYVVVGVGNGGSAFQREILNTGPTTSYIMNLPLLNDVDSAGQSTSILYWAAGGAEVWPGAVLYRKSGSSIVTEQATSTADVASGVATSILPDPTTTTRFEDSSVSLTFNVLFGEDQFESTTVLNVLAGANALAVIKANGDTEIIQYTTAVFLDTNTVRVSGLLRGRRGTEPYATGHGANETVVLLSTLTAALISNPATDVGTPQTYIAPTIGQLVENSLEIFFTPRGEDLKPYSPVHLALTNPGTPDGVDISWVRRTRIGGELTDLVDAPLSEVTESYEVDILDAPGGAVLRTLTSSTQSVNYSAANITTDFGSLPATLDVVVYQLSAAVGRGKPAIASLET
jgi:hypothetical protein